MARETTGTLGRPVLRALQALPPSVLLKTPSRSTPTYMVVGVWGSMARDPVPLPVVRRVPTHAATSPLLFITPPPPASFPPEWLVGGRGSTVGTPTAVGVGRPVLTAVQLLPASMLLKTPPQPAA